MIDEGYRYTVTDEEMTALFQSRPEEKIMGVFWDDADQVWYAMTDRQMRELEEEDERNRI